MSPKCYNCPNPATHYDYSKSLYCCSSCTCLFHTNPDTHPLIPPTVVHKRIEVVQLSVRNMEEYILISSQDTHWKVEISYINSIKETIENLLSDLSDAESLSEVYRYHVLDRQALEIHLDFVNSKAYLGYLKHKEASTFEVGSKESVLNQVVNRRAMEKATHLCDELRIKLGKKHKAEVAKITTQLKEEEAKVSLVKDKLIKSLDIKCQQLAEEKQQLSESVGMLTEEQKRLAQDLENHKRIRDVSDYTLRYHPTLPDTSSLVHKTLTSDELFSIVIDCTTEDLMYLRGVLSIDVGHPEGRQILERVKPFRAPESHDISIE